jgi:EAL domain-containing protein (putative c-di-GMP-specific phosphodiesterase class I)
MSEITQLERLLLPGSLKVVFQPVFQVLQHGVKVIELEGLIRGPRGTHVESPDVLFEYVRRKGKESKLDRACTTAILEATGQLNTNLRIGINVTAATLGNDLEFPSFVRSEAERYRIATSRITIELVEHAPFWDGGIFLQALEALRNMGIRIALDDIGMGQSNYRMILDCHPDYFKVDKYVVQGSGADVQRRAILASALRLAHSFSAHVVAKGVEDVSDFQAIVAIGIDYMQGYLLAQPMTVEALLQSGLLNMSVPQRFPVDGSPSELRTNQSILVRASNPVSPISILF